MARYFDKSGRREINVTPFTDETDDIVLAPATAFRYTVPADARIVVFNSTDVFWASFSETVDAQVPAANVLDGTGSVFLPSSRNVVGLASFSLISPAACTISIERYL